MRFSRGAVPSLFAPICGGEKACCEWNHFAVRAMPSKGVPGGEAEIAKWDAAPFCKANEYTQDFLFISRDEVKSLFGSAIFKRKLIAMHDEEMLIGFAPPEQEGGPLRLLRVSRMMRE
jgi:hypothetical protein